MINLAIKMSEKAAYLYIVAIIVYIVSMFIKNKIIEKTNFKKKKIINTIFNITLFLIFILSLLLISGIKFNAVKEYIYNITLEKRTSIIATTIILIISTTILNTTTTLLVNHNNKNKRKQTYGKVMSSIIKYIVYIIDVAALLAVWGINIAPVLAGLGIAGLVIGLGAQKLITDFISGVFIIFEHHFDIGDLVEVDGFTGEVIDIGLKTTKIKSWKGEVKIIANGKIETLINYSVNNMTAIVDFGIAYKENIENVINILNDKLPEKMSDISTIIDKPKILGVINLDDSSVNLRALCIAKAGEQFDIERRLRKAIKETLDENNIEIPFPQLVVYKGDKNE